MASNIFASMPDDRFILQGNYLPVVDGELYTDHPINKLEDKMSDVSLFFKSLDFMTGTTSNEGSLVLMMAPSLQEHYKFNITEGIPSRFVCKAIINPFVKSFFNDESDVKQKMCEFYTVDTGISDQSMRATDIFSDIVFGYPTFKMLEYHTSTEGNTFHYLFSKTNDLHFGGPKPIWFKGCGHGEEVMYMFDIGTLLPSLESSELSAKDKEFSKRVIQYWTSFAKSG
jgi:carboxylesterase type B